MKLLSAAKFPLCILLILTPFLSFHDSHAATIAYWRFEDDPGFLVDSSGNGHTLTGSNGGQAFPPSQVATTFPNPVPQNGLTNLEAARFTAAAVNNGNRLTTANTDFLSTKFTIEMFINPTSIFANNSMLAGVLNASGNQRAWGFFLTPAGQLQLALSSTGLTGESITSTFSSAISAGNNYYVAVAVDLADTSANGITFYLQDLSGEGSLLTNSQTHTVTSLFASTASFSLGSQGSTGSTYNGTMDEVRYSNVVLSQGDLLAVPEPSSCAMLLIGGFTFVHAAGRRLRRFRKI